MPTSNINIPIDTEVKSQAQDVFAALGMDMATAINIFLKQAVRQQGIPFAMPPEPGKKTPKPGSMKGMIWMADDFDAPLEDFKEYME